MKLAKSVALIVAGIVMGVLLSAAASAVQAQGQNAATHPLKKTPAQLTGEDKAGYSFISDGGNGCWLAVERLSGPALAVAPVADCMK
jgi:hypothetical protein